VLLTHVPGAQSFEGLRTVGDHLCASFHDAAEMRGLIWGNDECDKAMEEALGWSMPAQLRFLLAQFMAYSDTTNALATWTKFKAHLMEDLVRRYVRVCLFVV
jgi:hypothetical protein